jgi:hypothetical protein
LYEIDDLDSWARLKLGAEATVNVGSFRPTAGGSRAMSPIVNVPVDSVIVPADRRECDPEAATYATAQRIEHA